MSWQMTDTVESLEAKVKALQTAKAPAPDVKAAKDQLVALKKAVGQAKKAAAPKANDEDGEAPAPVKAEAKATAPAEAAKPEATKPDATKPAAKKAGKPEAAKKAEPKLDTPKVEERKKSEKAEESPKKEADRKKSEKVAEPTTPAAQDPVESLTAKVSELKLPKDAKPAEKPAAAGKKAAAKGKPAEAAAVTEPAAETPKPAEPAKVEPAKGKKAAGKAPVASDDPPKAAEPVAETPAETGKKAKKVSERKQSTKAAEESPKPETKTEEPVKIHASSGEKKLRILAISGSLRKESFNTSLLKYAQKSAPSNVEIVIADISGLPFFNQDTEYEANPAVAKFKADVESADAILFATPEFNYSMPGVLKNAIDVASRPWGKNSWANKPTGLWSASVGGFGGLRGQMSLRQSAVFLKLDIYPGDEFLVSGANDKFDANGLADAATQNKASDYLVEFTKWVQARTKSH